MPQRRQTSRTALAVALLALTLVGSASLTAPASADPLPVPLPGEPKETSGRTQTVDRTVKMATLNILGSQHTRGGDHRRSVRTAKLIRRKNLDVLGMQEVQDEQLRVIKNRLPGYRIWPRQSLGNNGVRLQVAFRKSAFRIMDTGSIITTFSHQQRPIPWVRLRDRRTGRAFFFVSIHNSPQDQEAARDSATEEEIALYKRLHRKGPVFIVGDANERREFFCKVAGPTDARAASGGKATRGDGCQPPSGMTFDWILGGGRFDFRRYRQVSTRVSDHDLHTTQMEWLRRRR